jgi:putative transposase
MPNHVHGIINIVTLNDAQGIINIVGARFIAPKTNIAPKTDRDKTDQGVINHAPTLGQIVRAFKARCTYEINKSRNSPRMPVWQRNYYERVVRNDKELNETRQYIVENPMKWAEDENYM